MDIKGSMPPSQWRQKALGKKGVGLVDDELNRLLLPGVAEESRWEMFRHYVYERITIPERAEQREDPENFVSFIPNAIEGLSAYSMRSRNYLGTRCFYVSGNRQAIDRFVGKVGSHTSESHRVWECTAFVSYQAAYKAFRKDGRLLFEKLTTTDLEFKRREALAGEAMLRAHEAGATMEDALVVRDILLTKLNAEAASKKPTA